MSAVSGKETEAGWGHGLPRAMLQPWLGTGEPASQPGAEPQVLLTAALGKSMLPQELQAPVNPAAWREGTSHYCHRPWVTTFELCLPLMPVFQFPFSSNDITFPNYKMHTHAYTWRCQSCRGKQNGTILTELSQVFYPTINSMLHVVTGKRHFVFIAADFLRIELLALF